MLHHTRFLHSYAGKLHGLRMWGTIGTMVKPCTWILDGDYLLLSEFVLQQQHERGLIWGSSVGLSPHSSHAVHITHLSRKPKWPGEVSLSTVTLSDKLWRHMCCSVFLSKLHIHTHLSLHRIVDTMLTVLHMGFDVLGYFWQYHMCQ